MSSRAPVFGTLVDGRPAVKVVVVRVGEDGFTPAFETCVVPVRTEAGLPWPDMEWGGGYFWTEQETVEIETWEATVKDVPRQSRFLVDPGGHFAPIDVSDHPLGWLLGGLF